MRFDIVTVFPEAFTSYFESSIIGRAQKKRLIDIRVHDLRRWARGRHRSVDARPYGGGPGMVLMVEPIWRAVRALTRYGTRSRIIVTSAKGKVMTQRDARRWSKYQRLIVIAGHYEGIDERVATHIADEEVSIGEYVLTGGELPAMVIVDAVARLVPGVLGRSESLAEESFSEPGYREYPHYTRPAVFEVRERVKDREGRYRTVVRRWRVPPVLLSGDHKKIAEWRRAHAKYVPK
jgi:tRNA (guanine37-N1)-methyltransferase